MTHRLVTFLVPALALALLAFLLITYRTPTTYGSVAVSNEYVATTTAPNTLYGATVSSTRTIKGGPGALGSVIVTGANTGILNIYDATTTNGSLREARFASSTILVASLPASLAAGTYTFDVNLKNGLLVEITGTVATSTITYR